MEVFRRAATILALRIVWRSRLMVTFCLMEHLPGHGHAPNLTSAVESQFSAFWADKFSRFNKSLLEVLNSDE